MKTLIVAVVLIASALSAFADGLPTPTALMPPTVADKCIVGDIDTVAEVPTLIKGCTSKSNTVGGKDGYWLVATTCPSGLVGVRTDQGDVNYDGRFPGAVVSCLTPLEARDWNMKMVEKYQKAINALGPYLPTSCGPKPAMCMNGFFQTSTGGNSSEPGYQWLCANYANGTSAWCKVTP